ncbi:MAG: MotA/TolQ/ExbB proton channel family protein [Trueperaceae bacterium]
MDLLISGGVVLLAIALLSVYAVYLFLVRLFKLAKERLDTDELMARVNAAVRDRDLDLALDACEQHGGPVARVLQSALLRLPYGRQAVEAAFAEASLLEEQSLTRGLRPLATIAQVAPLLGLLGTVTGMIIAFGEISVAGTGNPGLLAGGIGQALVTTAAGLIVAIPVLIGQNYLASRVDSILIEIDRRREELMANVVQAVAAGKEPSVADVGEAPRAEANRAEANRAEPKTAARRTAPRPAPGARSEASGADQAPLPFGAEPPVPARSSRLRVERAGGDAEGAVDDRDEPRS